jgi:hypothetical protein
VAVAKQRTIAEKAKADAVFLIASGVVAGVVLCSYGAWITAGLTVIWLYMIWEGCARPTVCDVRKIGADSGCTLNAPGRLRACWRPEHRRVKRRTLISWMRTPSQSEPADSVWHRHGRFAAHETDGVAGVVPAPAAARMLLLAIVVTGAGAVMVTLIQFIVFA